MASCNPGMGWRRRWRRRRTVEWKRRSTSWDAACIEGIDVYGCNLHLPQTTDGRLTMANWHLDSARHTRSL